MTDNSAVIASWPERIYLQHSEDGYPVPAYKVDTDEISWCEDRQFDCDVEYVRANQLEAEREENARLLAANKDCIAHFNAMRDDLEAERGKAHELECELEDRKSTNVGWRAFEAERGKVKRLVEALHDSVQRMEWHYENPAGTYTDIPQKMTAAVLRRSKTLLAEMGE